MDIYDGGMQEIALCESNPKYLFFDMSEKSDQGIYWERHKLYPEKIKSNSNLRERELLKLKSSIISFFEHQFFAN